MNGVLPIINIFLTLSTGILFLVLYLYDTRRSTKDIEESGISKYLLNPLNIIKAPPVVSSETDTDEKCTVTKKVINQYCGTTFHKEKIECDDLNPPPTEQWVSCEEANELLGRGESSVCDAMIDKGYCKKSCGMCDRENQDEDEPPISNEITDFTFTQRNQGDVALFRDTESSACSNMVGCDGARDLLRRGYPSACNEMLSRGYCINTCLEPCGE